MKTFEVDGHPVSWVRDGKLSKRPLLVLAHGAGAPYTSGFMAHTAKELARRELAVLRFHFPYMERAVREERRRPPDGKKRLLATWSAMLDIARKLRNRGPLVVGGKSMGGRMASMLLAGGDEADVRGAVYLGYPLHPAGRPEKLRKDHLAQIAAPQLFVSGTRDPLCDLALLRPILPTLADARLHVVDGGDHSLSMRRSAPLEGSDEWLDAVAAFARDVAEGNTA